jgi:hypothetical protein
MLTHERITNNIQQNINNKTNTRDTKIKLTKYNFCIDDFKKKKLMLDC